MDERVYWIWLSLVFSCGSNKPLQILSFCNSPKAFYEMGEDEMKSLGFLTERDVKNARLVSLRRAEKVLSDCERIRRRGSRHERGHGLFRFYYGISLL